jgi:hypothetical protein
MRIKNLSDSNCNQKILGVQFTNGISEHYTPEQLDKLTTIGIKYELISEDCSRCEKYKAEILKLKQQLRKKLEKE